MLTTLKSGKNIQPQDIETIVKNGQEYQIVMENGDLFDLLTEEYSYFMKIYAYLLEIVPGTAINMSKVSSCNGDKITMNTGKILPMTAEKIDQFKSFCQPTDLEAEKLFLEGKNINDDYNKLP